ncbi:MAG: hypothetical protein JSS20_01230 [Proteobacteria bacterium]|nr:hypothetical protein [Pseudomonadota bacterium]
MAIDRALARYPLSNRARVAAVACQHPYLADLALSFPALLAAIAAGQPFGGESPARALVASGASLRRAAEAAGVPMWLRKLPPEAFPGRPPRLPDGEMFSRRIVNLTPKLKPARLPAWLRAINAAWQTGGIPFALWVAENHGHDALSPRRRPPVPRRRRHIPSPDPIHALGLFAWFSGQPGTQGHALIEKTWHIASSPREAVSNARSWLDRVELRLALGDEAIVDTWLAPALVDGFEFVPLRTECDVLAEAVQMRNCVATFGPRVRASWLRIWSVRRAGNRVATLEINRRRPLAAPILGEIEGPANTEAPAEVWRAAYRWLAEQPKATVPTGDYGSHEAAPTHWQRMWQPYWGAMGLKTWLPLKTDHKTLSGLRAPLW